MLPLSLQADLFGRKAFATTRGLISTVQTGGMILGPILAGLVYDNTESYFWAFIVFASVSFMAMLLILGASRPAGFSLGVR